MKLKTLISRACLTALAVLFFTTSSFAQRAVQAGDFIVHYYTQSDRLARRVLEYAQENDSLPGLPANAPSFGTPIHIHLANNNEVFRQLTGGQAPEWGVGVAASEAGVIVLRAYTGRGGGYDELRSVLRHELAHIALYRYIAPARIPRWFNEGYAEWSAGELDNNAAWMLRAAFASERAPNLDSLELSWPIMSSDARVAYALAATVVQYLVRESGTRGLSVFLTKWHTTQSFDKALAATYGLSVDQLETHWRRDVKKRYGWLAALTQTSIAVTLMSIGVLALYFIRRRRDRARLAVLKATEPPDQPAYWTESEDPGIDPGTDPEDIENHGEKNE